MDDYVRLKSSIQQQAQSNDCHIAVGVWTSEREFITRSTLHSGIKNKFAGKGVDEIGIAQLLGDDSTATVGSGGAFITINSLY